MALSKKDRQIVWNKSGGHCWYCGCVLPEKGWHGDHFKPVFREVERVRTSVSERKALGGVTHKYQPTGNVTKPELDTIDNIVPSCAPCNLFKSVFTVEEFRTEIEAQVERARNTSVNFRTAERFGLIEVIDAPVVFWFELSGLECANS